VTTALRPFAVPGRAELDAALDDLGRPWDGGPFSEPARRELARHVEVVTQALAELDRQIDKLAAPDGRMVVTHGEPHPGNLIQTSAGLVLIDWDTVAVARRRDAERRTRAPGPPQHPQRSRAVAVRSARDLAARGRRPLHVSPPPG
jgi:aminoglycoside phosphotransferase (APT) family kinase protein